MDNNYHLLNINNEQDIIEGIDRIKRGVVNGFTKISGWNMYRVIDKGENKVISIMLLEGTEKESG